jgi:hypothetical protein
MFLLSLLLLKQETKHYIERNSAASSQIGIMEHYTSPKRMLLIKIEIVVLISVYIYKDKKRLISECSIRRKGFFAAKELRTKIQRINY